MNVEDAVAAQPWRDREGSFLRPAEVALGWTVRTALGIAQAGAAVARQIPGGAPVVGRFSQLGCAMVVSWVRPWLAEAVTERDSVGTDEPDAPHTERETPRTLRAAMAELLNRSTTSRRVDAQNDLYASILGWITPDEARILAGLADEAIYPVVHVVERTGIGPGASRFVLRNASNVGRAVGTTLTSEVPHYLTRLEAWGLIEIGPHQPDMDDHYELLQTDADIRAAMRSARHTRILRGSVRISELGQQFWHACDPSRP